MARKSSPNFFLMKPRLTSPIMKNGTLIIKAPIIRCSIVDWSVKICDGITSKAIMPSILSSISIVSQSINPTIISSDMRIQVIMDSALISKTQKVNTKSNPLRLSTIGYLGEIFSPQLWHFPLSASQLNTGIKSLARIFAPQVIQCDERFIKDSLRGSLNITTLRKLPILIPNKNTIV